MAERSKKRKDLGPPPRWLHCPRKGAVIAGKFLPFKTPLDDTYGDSVPAECSFTPQMLISSLSNYKTKMGLWIDLTNTTRFYNKEIVESFDIKYIKLQCRGHGECPDLDQTATFIQLCQIFISQNPLKIIGVHCTHGFNRTGFLITSYLVENLSWSVEAATNAFSQCRPPGIYKKDYILELFKRYGDVEDAPPPPQLPAWCNEPDNMTDDAVPIDEKEGSSNESRAPHKRRKEFHKKNPVFMEGVPGVSTVTDRELVSSVQRRCQDMCNWKSSGFPGSQPVSMDVNNIQLLTTKSYQVSWKADGTRYMMLIDGENECYFIDRDNSVFHASHLWFPRRKAPTEHITKTLLDGEMIIDKVGFIDVPRYLVYDIVKFEGLDVGETDFNRRRLCINKEIIHPRRTAMEEGRIDRAREPFSIRAKDFWDITTAQAILSEKFSKKLSHDIDGLIFQPVDVPYISGQCKEVLKWKPPNLNSVDFRLNIMKESGVGIVPKPIGYLFVGGLETPFAFIKVTKAIKQLDKKIIECKYENNEWVFLRERTDKSFPNSYSTANSVCNSIKHPVTSEILFNCIDQHRFKNPKQTPGSCSSSYS